MHPELIEYIKQQREAGVPDDVIRQATLASGWAADEVTAIFSSLGIAEKPQENLPQPAAPETTPIVEAPKKIVEPEIAPVVAESTPATKRPNKLTTLLLWSAISILALLLATGAGYLLGQSDHGSSSTATISGTPTPSPSPSSTATASPSPEESPTTSPSPLTTP